MDQQLSLKQPSKEEFQRALALRHQLAMNSIGLIRTCIHVQEPVFSAFLDVSRNHFKSPNKSLELQTRMVKAVLDCMNDLDALAEEVLELIQKEKTNA